MARGLTGELARAQTWDDFVGQEKLKRQVQVRIQGAAASGPGVNDNEQLEHMLLCAEPGFGKTTLAQLIANALYEPFASFLMPTNEKDFLAFFVDYSEWGVEAAWRGGIVLLDELHLAPEGFQHRLLTGLEDGYLQGPRGKRVSVSHTTFIGATTLAEEHRVVKPLRDRFLVRPHFEPYSLDEMTQVVRGMARRCELELSAELAAQLARAAGGTPRSAAALISAARPLAKAGEKLTLDTVLAQAGVDRDGLADRELSYLRALAACGGQAGLRNLCTMLGMSQPVVEEMEPLLLRLGLIQREPQGRLLTARGEAKITRAARDTGEQLSARRAQRRDARRARR